MHEKNTATPNPVKNWNELRAELEIMNDRLVDIVDRFTSVAKREHTISTVEFQSQVLTGFECISKGFSTILALTNIEPSYKKEPQGEGKGTELAATGTRG